MRFTSQQIISYCVGLQTQNLGLREVELEPSPLRGIWQDQHATRYAEEKKLYWTAWTHIWIPALREVDLETSGMRRANRTEALVSLYWPSWSLHLKQPPSWISYKSNKVDPIRLSQNWKKSNLISKPDVSSAY